MANPLSPLSASGQNLRSPPTIARNNSYKMSTTSFESKSHATSYESEIYYDEHDESLSSSPFMADVDNTVRSPLKRNSPSKALFQRQHTTDTDQGQPLTETALREKEDGSTSEKILEETRTTSYSDVGNDTMSVVGESQNYAGADDTCLSAFSAVPNTDMTMFARTGHSPTRITNGSPTKSSRRPDGSRTPMRSRPNTPGHSRRNIADDELDFPSPTPRRHQPLSSDDSTNLILDFTERFDAFSQPSAVSPTRQRSSPNKSHTQPDLQGYLSSRRQRSPTRPKSPSDARHLTNLLDFDLPPAPTPRSIPTVSIRELETLKSSFQSQISSFQATLSGKEAEIQSLKTAKDDAEKRAGETQERVQDLRELNETLLADKTVWEKRDSEMQTVLRNVKEELIRGDREREELATKARDLEQRCEDSEKRLFQSNTRISELENAGATPSVPTETDMSTPGSGTNKAVEVAVDRVARELHSLYKAKHEAKVGALKKSYEARWEKKIRELQHKVDELTRENEELKLGRDATMSGVVPGMLAREEANEEVKTHAAENEKRFEEIQQDVAALMQEIESLKANNEQLQHDLAASRRENSEMVEQVEQMLLLELADPPAPSQLAATADHLRGSVSRPPAGRPIGPPGRGMGLAGGLGAGESRIGMMKARSTSGTGSGSVASRSGIMSNIERMGRVRAAE